MKHVKCLFERKRVCMNRLTWADSENHALEVVWITYMGRFFQVSSGQSYYFAWFWDCIWFNSRSSPVWVYISQPRWILVKRPMGRLTSSTLGWFPLLFGPLGAFLCTCCWEHLLDLRIRNMWSLSGQGSGPPHFCYYFHLGVSVHRGQTPAAQLGAHLSPVSNPLRDMNPKKSLLGG